VGLFVEEFAPDQTWTTRGRTVGEGDIMLFAGLSGDFNPVHVDAAFCATTEFGERIAHGPMTLAMSIGLMSQHNLIDGTALALLNLHWDFNGPVRIGDTVHAHITCVSARKSRKPDRGVVTLRIEVLNHRQESIQTGTLTLLMKTRDS
jgi:acyl dehydratase